MVGFPGSGKTTLGRKLATLLGMRFIDLDTAIEDRYKTTVPRLFQKYGEPVFRACEYSVLNECLTMDGVLIATGGGAPCYRDAMDCINRTAISVYVSLSEQDLFQRLKNSRKPRPLTQNLNDDELADYIHRTLIVRSPFYEQAKLKVDGLSPDVVLLGNKIVSLQPL